MFRRATTHNLRIRCLAVVPCIIIVTTPVAADVTPDQAKELRTLKVEVGKVAAMLRKKEFEEAAKVLDAAEAKVKEIMMAAEIEENDRRLQGLPQLIAARRKVLDAQMSKASPGAAAANNEVSFVDDVAPIISDNCLGCHGADNPRANLRLDVFAGWKRGGQNGLLLTPGNASRSLLALKLIAPDNVRMPKGSPALEKDEIETVAKWINEGAEFDGDGEMVALGRLKKPKAMANITIPMPKGTETVSFTKDIAPMMVRLCIRCHSGNNPASGLSLVTFEDIMVGGDSGEVIIPGDKENSRLFRLVGGLEAPRMPQGQARITRKNYEDLIKWFEEGNAFDGEDPKATLISYVPTDEDLANQRFAAMSESEFVAHRKQRTEELWKRSLPNDAHETLESEQFIVVGDVPKERLQQVEEWATAHVEKLRKTFDAGSEPLWKGKLSILVFKERFGLTEFAVSVRNARAPEGMYGDSVVTTSQSDAYVVVQDIGDDSSADTPGLKANLIDHLTGAFLQRQGPVPQWITRGGGLLMAAQESPGNPYIQQLPRKSLEAATNVGRPRELFEDGTFSPASVGPVGYTLVEYLTDAFGNARFAQLILRVQSGTEVGDAIQAVYGTSSDDLGQAFLAALRRAAG